VFARTFKEMKRRKRGETRRIGELEEGEERERKNGRIRKEKRSTGI
jgi:hypothetical protein